MRIVTLDTLKTMPDGTVFCLIDRFGNFNGELTILTGRYDDEDGFNGTMSIMPVSGEDENCKHFYMTDRENHYEYRLNENIKTQWETFDTSDIDLSKHSFYAVFSKKEVAKMIKVLQWALSDLEDDFDMEEVLE